MAEGSKSVVKKTHRTVLDASAFKIDLGLIDSSWNWFIENIHTLVNFEISDDEVRKFYQDEFFDKNLTAEEQGIGFPQCVL